MVINSFFCNNFLKKSSKVSIYLHFSDTITLMEDNYNASTFELQNQSKIFGEKAFARGFCEDFELIKRRQ